MKRFRFVLALAASLAVLTLSGCVGYAEGRHGGVAIGTGVPIYGAASPYLYGYTSPAPSYYTAPQPAYYVSPTPSYITRPYWGNYSPRLGHHRDHRWNRNNRWR